MTRNIPTSSIISGLVSTEVGTLKGSKEKFQNETLSRRFPNARMLARGACVVCFPALGNETIGKVIGLRTRGTNLNLLRG